MRARQRRDGGVRWFLHPVALQAGAWVLVAILYGQHLSLIFISPTADAWLAAAAIIVPFALAALALQLGLGAWRKPAANPETSDLLPAMQKRWRALLLLWCLASLVEIAFSRGVPLYWRITRDSKTYFDFGIPSLHGFLDSLVMALSLVGADLALRMKRNSYWLGMALTLGWTIAILNRQMLIGMLLEAGVLVMRRWRIRASSLVSAAAAVLAAVLLFGALGDLRTGAESFRYTSEFTGAISSWLPSGFLWFYMYLATPMNNLLYNIATRIPLNSWHLYNTLTIAVPSIWRPLFIGAVRPLPPSLVTPAFTVSTGYASIYLDLGWRGIVLMSAAAGIACQLCWRGRSARAAAFYAVMAQCIVISVFVDSYLYLPIIFQLAWLAFIYARPQRTATAGRGAIRG